MDSGAASKRKDSGSSKKRLDQHSNRSAKRCSSEYDSHSLKSCKKSDTKSGSRSGSLKSMGSRKQSQISETQRSSFCYPTHESKKRTCTKKFVWQNGTYVRDECGSGIVPLKINFVNNRQFWCKTPLTMYQATIGEMGRKILCREEQVKRDIKPEPPCNIDEFILPLCRGYYRKKDCLRPCEDEHSYMKYGVKHYRNRVERYWQPCLTEEQKQYTDINEFAGHNVFLAQKMRRLYSIHDRPCW